MERKRFNSITLMLAPEAIEKLTEMARRRQITRSAAVRQILQAYFGEV